jgi:signal transduction histidine kinase
VSPSTDERLDELLEVLARASVGDVDARVDVSPDDLDDPIVVIGNAVNLLLDDLAYRQRERERALLAAREAATKEELLSYLSHDMQTPLSLLLGTLTLLDDSPDPAEVATAVPIMRRAATRLQRFVSQFLDLARLGAERPLLVELSAIDVREVAERTVSLFTQRAAVPIELPDDRDPRS